MGKHEIALEVITAFILLSLHFPSMNMQQRHTEIPTWIAGLFLAVVAVSFLYGIVVMQSLVAPIAFWVGALSIAVGLFVVYLLYRFVLAVETIADKL